MSDPTLTDEELADIESYVDCGDGSWRYNQDVSRLLATLSASRKEVKRLQEELDALRS